MGENETIKKVQGDPNDSYSKLLGFFYMLEKTNINSYTEIKIDTNSNFRYGFMGIGACISGFMKERV